MPTEPMFPAPSAPPAVNTPPPSDPTPLIAAIFRSGRDFHFTLATATQPWSPDPASRGYPGTGRATEAAIKHTASLGLTLQFITGHADKNVARALGVPYKDHRWGGKHTPFQAALSDIYTDMKENRITQFPQFLARLSALGLRTE